MDMQTAFQNLVNNKYMPGFDYAGTSFSFQTVFSVDNVFSYCICECGFNHEYLDYITESGEIDQEIYEKVLKCIADCRCPHVNQVPKEFVKEAEIFGIHVAVATGTRDALVDGLSRLPVRYTNLYHLDPYVVALLKNNNDEGTMDAVRNCFRKIDNYRIRLVSARKLNNDTNTVLLRSEKVLDFLSRTNKEDLLKSYLADMCETRNFTCRDDLFRLSLKYNADDDMGLGMFLERFDKFLQEISDSTMWSILCYDKAKVLDSILTSLKDILNNDDYFLQQIHRICHIFQSHKCVAVLEKRGLTIPDNFKMTITDKIQQLMDLFCEKPQVLQTEIKEILLQMQVTGYFMKSERDFQLLGNCLMLYNKVATTRRSPEVLKKLLDCGKVWDNNDISHRTTLVDLLLPTKATLNSQKMTPLSNLLDIMFLFFQKIYENQQNTHVVPMWFHEAVILRQMVELYLYENPNTSRNDDAIKMTVKVDMELKRLIPTRTPEYLIGVYQKDGQKHSLFGHDNRDDFALNFMVPLLLECGFPFNSDLYQKSYVQINLHPGEREYISWHISFPRSLKLCCRDCLRKHFSGRNIHQFVEYSNIPQPIKDFILLKPLLKCASVHLLF